jgi:hypothetical protein
MGQRDAYRSGSHTGPTDAQKCGFLDYDIVTDRQPWPSSADEVLILEEELSL